MRPACCLRAHRLWAMRRHAFIGRGKPFETGSRGRRMKTTLRTLAGLMLALALFAPAQAASLSAGIAAYEHQDYNAAAAILRPLAIAGDPRAQSYVGYMYATGRGFPQNYNVAAYWYFRAANQGETTAQYQLGLLYDKGDGVQQDVIKAHMWLDLAAAH